MCSDSTPRPRFVVETVEEAELLRWNPDFFASLKGAAENLREQAQHQPVGRAFMSAVAGIAREERQHFVVR